MAVMPSQVSATSHAGYPRHVEPLDASVSAGQVVLEPVQVSATSHSPAAARAAAPPLPAGCWQFTLLPSH
jgi:hypothetical protein